MTLQPENSGDHSRAGSSWKTDGRFHTDKIQGYARKAFETLKHLLTEVRVEDDSRPDTYNRLARHVAESGLTFRDEVPKDGNCMFHAVADQLFRTEGRQISHGDLRKQVVDYLRGCPYNCHIHGIDRSLTATISVTSSKIKTGKVT
ncbi:uncharacterized protein LOC118424976 [Branchiostoma floridae]|uniref:Uncharacterized protein LOC118424976 n=1 Tax=Branchiostoma floridae TaxID=7739 RepID=A0A9J7LY85_BRAFL|nr:uncharacterized protein LOC118424976 [Branchiostoma floridae]